MISDAAGKKYFIGSLWMAILRSQKGRNTALRILTNKIPKMQEDEGRKSIHELED